MVVCNAMEATPDSCIDDGSPPGHEIACGFRFSVAFLGQVVFRWNLCVTICVSGRPPGLSVGHGRSCSMWIVIRGGHMTLLGAREQLQNDRNRHKIDNDVRHILLSSTILFT